MRVILDCGVRVVIITFNRYKKHHWARMTRNYQSIASGCTNYVQWNTTSKVRCNAFKLNTSCRVCQFANRLMTGSFFCSNSLTHFNQSKNIIIDFLLAIVLVSYRFMREWPKAIDNFYLPSCTPRFYLFFHIRLAPSYCLNRP